MGFVGTHNIILDDDVILDEKSIMTYQQKIEDISSYKESPLVEIIKPTIEICNLFKDNIFYSLASVRGYKIINSRLEVVNLLTNKYDIKTFESLVDHFSDKSKIYYLSKIVKIKYPNSNVWSMFLFEKSNISNVREEKINSILNENNSM
jgi:hypothetical protein